MAGDVGVTAGRRPVAVVTGAGRGIGAATARLLAEDGWELVLLDRGADDPAIPYPLATRQELEAVAAACKGIAVLGDVREQADLDAAVTTAVDTFGGLDAAVSAAGVMGSGGEAWRVPDATWDAVVGVNLEGVWRLARAAVPSLLARDEPRQGRFVAVASVAGMTGIPLLAAYAAAKHGVVGLVRSLAAELGPHGVTANVVSPGSTDTDMLLATASIYGLTDASEFAVHHPVGRLVRPTEVAGLIRWLVGPDSSGITGAVLP
ncbi:MAG TPA: mycofactocin-coupled SDR family oxidoreductase, partial [Acidimicrobiales bacterium]|nr:mycofactocin-coupled SDR family oxidoreductase [Acidimicrobiales bacterium]